MRAAEAYFDHAEYDACLSAAGHAETLRRAHGHERQVAVIQALRGRALRRSGHAAQARLDLLAAMRVLEAEPGLDTVEVAAALASASALGHHDDVEELTARAIALAEGLGAGNRLLSDTFNSRGLMLNEAGRRLEAIAHFRQSVEFAEAAGDVSQLAIPLTNLADVQLFSSPRDALIATRRSMDVARQVGSRYGMSGAVANAVLCLLRLGDWDAAVDAIAEAVERDGLGDLPEVTSVDALIRSLRGDPAGARQIFQPMFAAYGDDQSKAYDGLVLAQMAAAEGDLVVGLAHAREALDHVSPSMDPFVLAWPLAARLAYQLSDSGAMSALLGKLDGRLIGEIPPLVRAERRLVLARRIEEPTARTSAIEDAVTDLRAEGSPYHLALALLDLAEAQRSAGKDPADVVAEAASIGAVLRCPQVVVLADRLADG
jgi:tetratricopeptide (TPR) repeat protein